jgi:hypothetical protein
VMMADQCLYAAKHSGRDAWVGVIVADDAAEVGPRLVSQLGAVVTEGGVRAMSSLPEGAPLRWQ